MAKKQVAISASLPRDDDSASIQVLSPAVAGTVHRTTTEGASARVQLPSNTDVVRVASNVAVWVAFGGSTVDAADTQTDSLLFPAGAEVFNLRDRTYTYIAARSVAASGNGLVTATKME
jgi:hypothetical protein